MDRDLYAAMRNFACAAEARSSNRSWDDVVPRSVPAQIYHELGALRRSTAGTASVSWC